MNIDNILKEIEKQLEEKEAGSQVLVNLENGRAIEVIHHEENLQPEEQYFSVKLYCSEREFEKGYFADNCGVIETDISECTGDSTDIDAIKAPLKYVLHAGKSKENKISFIQKLRTSAVKALRDCTQTHDRMIDMINAEFALGKFYAIAEILEDVDVDEWLELMEESDELRFSLIEMKEQSEKFLRSVLR